MFLSSSDIETSLWIPYSVLNWCLSVLRSATICPAAQSILILRWSSWSPIWISEICLSVRLIYHVSSSGLILLLSISRCAYSFLIFSGTSWHNFPSLIVKNLGIVRLWIHISSFAYGSSCAPHPSHANIIGCLSFP